MGPQVMFLLRRWGAVVAGHTSSPWRSRAFVPYWVTRLSIQSQISAAHSVTGLLMGDPIYRGLLPVRGRGPTLGPLAHGHVAHPAAHLAAMAPSGEFARFEGLAAGADAAAMLPRAS